MDVLWALLLIGLALCVGGILLRRVPSSWLVVGAVLVVFGLGIPALVIDDTSPRPRRAPEPARRRPAAEATSEREGGGEQAEGGRAGRRRRRRRREEGKLIFTQSCGTCHVLGDAGTNGQVGPNLDDLSPTQARV